MPASPHKSAIATADPPERWSVDAGDDASATLSIPADARIERRFEIACATTVVLGADCEDGSGWHQMTVRVDGNEQWR
ncbi:MAG: hypothetical protein ABIN96_12005, partial [Rubrivivax sp.]